MKKKESDVHPTALQEPKEVMRIKGTQKGEGGHLHLLIHHLQQVPPTSPVAVKNLEDEVQTEDVCEGLGRELKGLKKEGRTLPFLLTTAHMDR